MKILLYFDPSSSPLKIPSSLGYYERPKFQARVLLKYFPKYIKSLSSCQNSSSFKSRIKRAKIIRDFKSCLDKIPLEELRLLLGPKIKSVKHLVNYEASPAQFFEQIKLCTALNSIDLGVLGRSDHPSFDIAKACKRVRKLKNLRSLRLPITQDTGWALDILKHIPLSSRFLSRLRILHISCSCKGDEQLEFFNLFFQNKNLLRFTTELYLETSCSPLYYERFRSLIASCANFQKLTSLKVEIYDLTTFFEDFALPSSLQNLTLDFKMFFSQGFLDQIEAALSDPENSAFTSFFNKFQDLPYLQTLEIFSPFEFGFHWSYHYQYYRYISQGILKRVSSLKNLIFLRSNHSAWSPNRRSPGPDSSFPEFLEFLNYLGQTLEKLEFGHEKLTIRPNCDLSSSRDKFTKLSTITITGRIEDSIPTFLGQILSLGNSIKTIRLNTFCKKSSKILLETLKGLHVLQRPELEIQLEIKFLNYAEQHIIMSDFESGIKELQENDEEYPFLQKVSLKLLARRIFLKPMKRFVELYGKKFMHFQHL